MAEVETTPSAESASAPVDRSGTRKGDRPDVLPAWAKVDKAVLRQLSQVSDARSVLAIGGDWLAIIGAGLLCWYLWHPVLYVVTVLFIGARQHDLLVLMHDAAHYRLFRNRAVNDWAAELFLTWPFLVVNTHGYRANHWAHHRHLNTADDPDLVGKIGPGWVFPMPAWRLAVLIVTDAIGFGQPRIVPIVRRLGRAGAMPRAFKLAKLVFVVAALAIIVATGAWKPVVLFWLVPFLTWTPALLRLRALAEHYGIHEPLPVGTRSRTVLPTLLDRLFVVGHPVWYHAEHHFYPSVPLHRLADLHDHLMQREAYREKVHVTRGYLRTLWEVTTEGWAGPREPVPGMPTGYSV